MKRIKSLLSVFVLTLAATACAGNSGENKKSNENFFIAFRSETGA